MKTVTKTLSVLAVSIAAASAAPVAFSEGMKTDGMSKEESHYFSNGWREGKIEAAVIFNENLSPFEIDVEVNGNTAHLVGTVGSEIDKNLAEQVALGVEGITEVKNELKVNPDVDEAESSERHTKDSEFVRSVKDATLTAQVKMKLLGNESVSGLDIDVDTDNEVVTLKGAVPTDAVKQLAEKVASNTENVREVRNQLTVSGN